MRINPAERRSTPSASMPFEERMTERTLFFGDALEFIGRTISSLLRNLRERRRHRRELSELMAMNSFELKDIGLNPTDLRALASGHDMAADTRRR